MGHVSIGVEVQRTPEDFFRTEQTVNFKPSVLVKKHLTVSSLLPLIMLRLNVKRVSLFLELT